MRQAIFLLTLASLLSAGPASALSARRHIDADNRASVALPADKSPAPSAGRSRRCARGAKVCSR